MESILQSITCPITYSIINDPVTVPMDILMKDPQLLNGLN